jgi:hypothetical protein
MDSSDEREQKNHCGDPGPSLTVSVRHLFAFMPYASCSLRHTCSLTFLIGQSMLIVPSKSQIKKWVDSPILGFQSVQKLKRNSMSAMTQMHFRTWPQKLTTCPSCCQEEIRNLMPAQMILRFRCKASHSLHGNSLLQLT